MATGRCAISVNCDSLTFCKYFSLRGKGLFAVDRHLKHVGMVLRLHIALTIYFHKVIMASNVFY